MNKQLQDLKPRTKAFALRVTPPLPEQRQIVSELDARKRLQAETTAELDAFLPAIAKRLKFMKRCENRFRTTRSIFDPLALSLQPLAS